LELYYIFKIKLEIILNIHVDLMYDASVV
jgi:hypothetical protein